MFTSQEGALHPLPSHYSRCFGCGRDHPTGLKMKMAGAENRVKGSFLVTEHHQGAPGLAHGGVLSAAVDEAMGYLLWLLAAPAVTAHLEVNFRRPVPVGSYLQLEGELERVEGRKIFAQMTGSLDGQIAVEASAIFIKVGVEHFTPHIEKAGLKIDQFENPYNP
jgi:acyl-coenzyme A thioesterase PaaI-like protein